MKEMPGQPTWPFAPRQVSSCTCYLPIITGGCRGDQETKSAVDVELAKSRILLPVDRLELWDFIIAMLAGRDGWGLDLDHGCGGFARERSDSDDGGTRKKE